MQLETIKRPSLLPSNEAGGMDGQLSSLEDLFSTADRRTFGIWEGKIRTYWADQWSFPDDLNRQADGHPKIGNLLQPELMVQSVVDQDLTHLEALRWISPVTWQSLLQASSKRQQDKLDIARGMMLSLPDDNLYRFDITKNEFDLFFKVAAETGELIDQAYFQQVKLADLPGGSAQTRLGKAGIFGNEFVYEKDNRVLAYRNVFGPYWPMVGDRLVTLSKWASSLDLPKHSNGLPSYLEQLGKAFLSTTASPGKTFKIWYKLVDLCRKLAQDGCPIIIIPPTTPMVAGEANKVDVELRFCLQTPETREWTGYLKKYQETAQKLSDKFESTGMYGKGMKKHRISSLIATIQPFAFGSGLHFKVRGEAGIGVIHIDNISDIALRTEFPLLKNLFDFDGLDEDEFVQKAIELVVTHENGHEVGTNLEKLGESNAIDVLDEYKAELVGMKIIYDGFDGRWINERQANNYLLTYISGLCNSIRKSGISGSSGERYYYSAAVILWALLKNGIIVRNGNGKYVLTDGKRGLDLLEESAEALLGEVYYNPKMTPEKAIKYVDDLKKEAEYPPLQEFLSRVRSGG